MSQCPDFQRLCSKTLVPACFAGVMGQLQRGGVLVLENLRNPGMQAKENPPCKVGFHDAFKGEGLEISTKMCGFS